MGESVRSFFLHFKFCRKICDSYNYFLGDSKYPSDIKTFFLNYDFKYISKTSMHSSRMRTVHLLPVSPSMHCAGGRGMSTPGGVSAPGGCLLWGVCSRGVSAPGGCLLQGGLLLGGVCSQGMSAWGCLLRGVSAPRAGVYPSIHWGGHPLWTERLKDR